MDPTGINALGVAAALGAAGETRLLAELVRRPATAAEHAAELGLDPRATAHVLDVLAAAGVAVRDEERFRAAPGLASLAEIPGGLDQHLALWAHTTHFLRTGEPFARMDAAPAERERSYQEVVPALGHMFSQSARDLAAQLDRAPRQILDIGCGSGVWSLAIAERFPGAQVTGLDLPAVLEAFESRAVALGLGSRITTLAGDMYSTPISPRSFDLALIANVLRLEAPDRARRLIARVAASLRPSGQLLVIDAMARGTPARERSRAVYALHLALRTDAGRVHPPAEIRAWLEEAGLADARELEIGDHIGALGALLARAAGGSLEATPPTSPPCE